MPKRTGLLIIPFLLIAMFASVVPRVKANPDVTRVQGNARGTSTSSTISVTMASTPTSGNMLIAAIGTDDTTSFSTVTNITQTGVTWTKQTSKNTYYNVYLDVEIWAGVVGSASTSITIALSLSPDSAIADVCEYSGLLATDFLDKTATNSGFSGTTDTGTTGTTTQANELWIGGTVMDGCVQINPANGFTLLDGPLFYGASVAYLEKIVNTTGAAYSGTTSASGGGDWVGCIATFKASPQNPTAPTSLLCEGATNATDVTDLTPEFSAIFNDPDTPETSNAIEVHVATTSAGLGSPDMWDSGWLADSTSKGSRCADKSYAGTTLTANTTYYWKCRFRDDDNNEGAWSAVQQFTLTTDMPTIGDFYAPSTYPNIPFLLNVTISYPNGNTSNFCNTTVILGDVTLLWINATDSFSISADPNDYCTLASGSSVTINLTDIRLSWNVTFAWNWPEGSKSPSGTVWVFSAVFSGSYKSATNSATDLFSFTSKTVIYEAVCPPSAVLGSTFYIVPTIYFQGTSVAVPDTGQVTLYAFRSGVSSQTTTIDVYGRARIPTSASVEGTFAWLIYAVTPAGTSVQNQTVIITIYSSGAPPSGPGPGGPTTTSQIALVTFYGSLVSLGGVARGQQISIPITITWTGTNQITVTNMSFIGPGWSVTFPQLPQTFTRELGMDNGTATLMVFVTVPGTTSLGSQQINVVVTAEGGIPPSQSQINCITQFTIVLQPIQTSPYTIQTIVGAMLAVSLGAILFVGARKKKSPV
jgi:hypothetical protein